VRGVHPSLARTQDSEIDPAQPEPILPLSANAYQQRTCSTPISWSASPGGMLCRQSACRAATSRWVSTATRHRHSSASVLTPSVTPASQQCLHKIMLADDGCAKW